MHADDCSACAQSRPRPGPPSAEERAGDQLKAASVLADIMRMYKTAGGILAARNAAARLCVLGSFVATGGGPRQPERLAALMSPLPRIYQRKVSATTPDVGPKTRLYKALGASVNSGFPLDFHRHSVALSCPCLLQ